MAIHPMATKIISDMNTSPIPNTALLANARLANSIKEYLVSNAIVTYSWAGFTPPPSSTPDPVLTFTAKFSTITGALLPSSDFSTFVLSLSNFLKTSVIVPNDSTFLMSPMTLNPAGSIILSQSGLSTFEDSINHLCVNIISAIKTTFINTIPVAGSHLSYVGTAIMTSISI